MKNNIRFGSKEASSLLINLVLAHVMLTFPKAAVLYGGSAGWIIPVIITFLAVCYFSLTLRLYQNIGSLDLLDISERVGGRVFKVIAGLIITIMLILTVSVILGGFSETLKIVSLDEAPFLYVQLIFFIGMIVAAYYGVEVVARISAFLVPVIITGLILITIGVIPDFKLINLYPILGQGIGSILEGSILKLSVFSSFLILFLMVPYFKQQYIKRVGYLSTVVSGLLLFWSTLTFILVFPYQTGINKKIPIFQMARHVDFGNYIQRVESVFILICSISALLYLGTLFSIATNVLSKTLDLNDHRPLIPSVSVIVFSLALIFKRINFDILDSQLSDIIWLVGLAAVLFIIILGALKKVGKKDKRG